MSKSQFQIEQLSSYTMMSNSHLRNRNMSLKAKGLLSVILSLPPTRDYSISGLVAICKESELAVTNALTEIKQFGYIEIVKLMPNETESKRFKYIYKVYQTPQQRIIDDQKRQAAHIQDIENQGTDNRGLDNPTLENQAQLNKQEYITKKVNTNLSFARAGTKKRTDKGNFDTQDFFELAKAHADKILKE